jgi:hypothetical protein
MIGHARLIGWITLIGFMSFPRTRESRPHLYGNLMDSRVRGNDM